MKMRLSIAWLSWGCLTAQLFAAACSLAQSPRSLMKKGNEQYLEKKYDDAETNYRKALQKADTARPGEKAAAAFNVGDALYKKGNFEQAASQFRSIASIKNTERIVQSGAYHNLGNSLLKMKKYEESIDAYKNALRLNPADDDTRYNLSYARSMLKQQQQQNNDQKKQDKDKKDQDKKNQDKNNQEKQDQKKQDQNKKQDGKNEKESKDDTDNKKPGAPKISKEDAQRILEALNRQEKDIQKKTNKKDGVRVNIEKDW